MHEISFINEFDINIDIPVSPRAEMQNIDVKMFGDFEKDLVPVMVLKQTEMNQQSRVFGGISDLEIEKLISSEEKHCQYNGKHLLGIWFFEKVAPREHQECVT